MKKTLVFIFSSLVMVSAYSSLQDDKQIYVAKYLVSLVRYFNWPPADKKGNFKIGVFGSFNAYKAISYEAVDIGMQGRNTDVINLTKIENVHLTSLHILIISGEASTSETMKKVKSLLGNSSTLIITDREGALSLGSCINFVIRKGKPAFELNKTNIKQKGIQFNREVEVFATKVEP